MGDGVKAELTEHVINRGTGFTTAEAADQLVTQPPSIGEAFPADRLSSLAVLGEARAAKNLSSRSR